jgi:hypothetical protein
MVLPLANAPVVRAAVEVETLPIVTDEEILNVIETGQLGLPARVNRFRLFELVVILITEGATVMV